jgi:hypothetical protein
MVVVREWQWQYWQSCGGLKMGENYNLKSGRSGGCRAAAGFVARGVAVVCCSWYRWIEEIRAVRMVVVREWQWQYWQSCGGLKMGEKKNTKLAVTMAVGVVCFSGRLRSGSG